MTDGSRDPRRDDPAARLGRALEVLVYGSLGLGALLREAAPSALETVVARGRAEAERRREEVVRHVNTVRSTGQVAVHFGLPTLLKSWRARAERGADTVRTRLSDARRGSEGLIAGVVGRFDGAARPGAPAAATPAAARVEAAEVWRPRAGNSAHLPIPGYDALSASQVVERLAGLATGELAAVRDYERAHRHRRTILGKIDQLGTSAPPAATPGP